MGDEITNMTAIFRPHPDCQKPRILLIEGEPGMGKTTYSQRLAFDWANEQDEWDASFPSIEVLLLLRCNDIKSGIWEAIDDQLLPDDIDKQAKENFFQYIQENQAKVLLLLDGLDEADSRKLDMYYSVVQSKLLASCHIVITSRHEVGKKVRPYCDTLWEIVGFSKEDAEIFIRKYSKGKEHLAEKLIKRLRRPLYLHDELAKSPLNTVLLCCLFEDYEGVLPASRTQLYVEIVLLGLRRYEEKYGLKSSREDLISVYRKELLLLGSFAFESLRKGELHFEKKEEIVKSINFGFLSFQQGGTKRKPCTRCAFLHKNFQEFFAGFYLAFQIINKEIDCASVVADERYLNELTQVFLFMGGFIAPQSQEIAANLAASLTGHINFLLRSDADEDTYERQLAVTCLTCEWLSECSSVKETVKTRLVCTIASHLDFSSVTCGYFGQSAVNDAFVPAIYQAVTGTSSLTELYLFDNSIGDFGAYCLSQALKANSSLTILNLKNNSIGDAGASSIFQALTANCSLTELDLSFNSIGDAGAYFLSQALTANSSLNILDLDSNSIGDAGAFYLSQALTANSSLTYLDLLSNSIGEDGVSCLSQAWTECSSLIVLNFEVVCKYFIQMQIC